MFLIFNLQLLIFQIFKPALLTFLDQSLTTQLSINQFHPLLEFILIHTQINAIKNNLHSKVVMSKSHLISKSFQLFNCPNLLCMLQLTINRFTKYHPQIMERKSSSLFQKYQAVNMLLDWFHMDVLMNHSLHSFYQTF